MKKPQILYMIQLNALWRKVNFVHFSWALPWHQIFWWCLCLLEETLDARINIIHRNFTVVYKSSFLCSFLPQAFTLFCGVYEYQKNHIMRRLEYHMSYSIVHMFLLKALSYWVLIPAFRITQVRVLSIDPIYVIPRILIKDTCDK